MVNESRRFDGRPYPRKEDGYRAAIQIRFAATRYRKDAASRKMSHSYQGLIIPDTKR